MPDKRRLDWKTWTADDIMLKHRVIGPLWNMVETTRHQGKAQRLIWSSGFHESQGTTGEAPPGKATTTLPGKDSCVYIPTVDGKIICAQKIIMEGAKEQAASTALDWETAKIE